MNISGMSLPLRIAPEPLDSDFEVESELPPLVTVISKEDLHKMKPKERKRQEIINGSFHFRHDLLLCQDHKLFVCL